MESKCYKRKIEENRYFYNEKDLKILNEKSKGESISLEQFETAIEILSHDITTDVPNLPDYFTQVVRNLIIRLGVPDMEEAQDAERTDE